MDPANPYCCEENVCYTEGFPCTNPDHAAGRVWVEAYRRERHFATAIESLDAETRDTVLAAAATDDTLAPFVQRYAQCWPISTFSLAMGAFALQ